MHGQAAEMLPFEKERSTTRKRKMLLRLRRLAKRKRR